MPNDPHTPLPHSSPVDPARPGGTTPIHVDDVLYAELHRIAFGIMRGRANGHTLGPTALLHEAYLKLQDRDGLEIRSRKEMLAMAARAMRWVLLDRERRWRRERLSPEENLRILDGLVAPEDRAAEIVDRVHEALERLDRENPEDARLVDLHFFAKLTFAEVADVLGRSERWVQERWRVIRLLLHARISDELA